MKDHYSILGISANSSQEEIKKAYKKLAIKFHPDKNFGDTFFEEHFKQIQEAYEILSNHETRKKYDDYRNSYSSNFEKKETTNKNEQGSNSSGKTNDDSGLTVDIRGDLVKINSKIIQFKSRYINTSNVCALRYGIYIKTINGIRSSYYTIWICDVDQKVITIECNRLLSKTENVERRYEEILEAIYIFAVPRILEKVRNLFNKGAFIQIGDCKLYKDVLIINCGIPFFKKENKVSWLDLKISAVGGQIHIYSKSNSKIGCKLEARRDWNAVLVKVIKSEIIGIKQ